MPTSGSTRTIEMTAPKFEMNLAYVAVSVLIAGFYLLVTKDSQMYVTNPHGFDYFLNCVLALQYSSALNVVVPGAMMLIFRTKCSLAFLNFFNLLFYFLFALYALLAAIAAGYYMGILYQSSGIVQFFYENGAMPQGVSETDLKNNSIIILCFVAVFNFFILPLYLMCCYCGKCLSLVEFT